MRLLIFLLTNSMPRNVCQVCFLAVASALPLLLCFPTSCLGSQYHGCLWDTCGDFEFSYPFGKINSGCGDPQFQLRCDQNRYLLLNISGDEYLVLQPSFFGNGIENSSITIINYNLWKTMSGKESNRSCSYSEFWWPASHFHIAHGYANLTLWRHCNESINGESFQKWRLCGDDWYSISNAESGRRFCKTNLQLPISNKLSVKQNDDLITALSFGFEITWSVDTKRDRSCDACLDSKGSCGFDILNPTTFLCYCFDSTSHPDRCPANVIGRKNKYKIVIGCSFGGVVLVALAGLLLFLTFNVQRKIPPPDSSDLLQSWRKS